MHVRHILEDIVGVRDSWGGDSGCDGVFVVAIVALCLGDCADVKECAVVSDGSSLISGILHDWYAPKI